MEKKRGKEAQLDTCGKSAKEENLVQGREGLGEGVIGMAWGELRQGNFSEEMDLEACRLPGSIAAGILLGAVTPDDINVFQTTAYNVTLTCYQMYHGMASGTLPCPQQLLLHAQVFSWYPWLKVALDWPRPVWRLRACVGSHQRVVSQVQGNGSEECGMN